MLPPLQPTTMSAWMPSRSSTFHMPTAAAHLTPPEPTTSATRGRPGMATAGVASGTRGLQRLADVWQLRFGRPLALLDDVRDLGRVEQPDGPAEVRHHRDDLGVVRQVVEGVVRAQQVVG